MGLKDNKIIGLIIITLVYILSSILGIFCYSILEKYFPLDKIIKNSYFWLNLLISDTISTIFVFIFSTILCNSSVYDAYWSVQPIVILSSFIYFYNYSEELLILLISILIWGLD